MKRTKILTVIFAIVLAVISSVLAYAGEHPATVYTPSGTAVLVTMNTNPLPEGAAEFMLRDTEEHYPDAENLAPPTLAYNCHSYAWIDQSTTNPYTLEDPTPFIQDPYYVETTTPEAGDIIVYYKANDDISHSGVIDEVLSGNSVNRYMVISKWGNGGLYRHKGGDCPYEISYVKYYCHEHLYTHVDRTIYTHTTTCLCGIEETEAHTWVQINELSGYRCTVCNYRSNFTPANPENVSAEIWMRLMAKTAVADGTTFVLDDMVFCYMDGQYYIVTEYTPDVVITPEVTE